MALHALEWRHGELDLTERVDPGDHNAVVSDDRDASRQKSRTVTDAHAGAPR